MSRLRSTIVAFALVFSIGLHWPLLQSLAWLNMIVAYSRDDGLQQAVVKTFSGKHPCQLCKFVRAGQKAEKKQNSDTCLKKLDLLAFSTPPFQFHPVPFAGHAEPASPPGIGMAAPLSPPPDAA